MEQNLQPEQSNFTTIIILTLILCSLTTLVSAWFLLNLSEAKTSLPPNSEVYFSVDMLEFIPDYFEQQGYLVPPSNSVLGDEEAFYMIIPTDHELDFLELITLLETELWHRLDSEFATTFDGPNLAIIELKMGDASFVIQIKEQSALDRVDLAQDRPKLAIVIDDWGYSALYADRFLQYPFPLTAAILPYLTYSVSLAREAVTVGHEVILHQPMEALNSYLDLGEGEIVSSMDENEIRETLARNFAHLPMIVGVNNHMGSKITAESDIMDIVLQEVKAHELYFFDSFTTSKSVVASVASELGVPYAVNDLFIDNVNEVEAIKVQLRRIMQRAINNGSAIAIGHVRSATAMALWEIIPEIIDANIELVPISQLLNYPQVAQVSEDEEPLESF